MGSGIGHGGVHSPEGDGTAGVVFICGGDL